MSHAQDMPPDFEPYAQPSGFIERVGPLMQRRTDTDVTFAVRIGEHHCNRRGSAHGGLIVTLADIALGKTGEWFSQPPASLLTASLTIDFYGPARLGDWLEAKTDVIRVGNRIAMGSCNLRVAERLIAHATGIFGVVTAEKD